MAEIARITDRLDCLAVDVLQRERTPKDLMELRIRRHLFGFPPSKAISDSRNRAKSTAFADCNITNV